MTPFDDQTLFAGLRELEANALEPGELHLLRALFRARGPLPVGRSQLVARLLRTSPLTPVAVRAHALPALAELEAGPYHLTVEVSAMATGAHRLYGQLLRDGEPAGPGEVVLTDLDGNTACAPLDDLGEFEVGRLAPGSYRAVLDVAYERIVVEPLAVGAANDP
jgi:hypothetical protein